MAELLTVDLHGLPEVTAWTVAMLERAQDMTPVWEAGHRAFLLEMREQFDTEGVHLTGEAWEALSPAYAAWKEKKYPGKPILQRTGALIESLTEEGAEGHINLIAPERAAFGTAVSYARHADKKRKIIVARDAYKRLLFRAAVAWVVGGRQLRDVTES